MSEPGGLSRRSYSYHSVASTGASESGRVLRDHSSSDRQPPSAQKRSGSVPQSGMRDAALPSGSSDHRHPSQRQRVTLWQVLFGKGSQRTSQRSTRQQAKRKDFKVANVTLPRNFLQRLKGDSKRLSNEQTASKLAENQVRQAVYGRSRELNGRSPATNAANPKGLSTQQKNSHRDGTLPSPLKAPGLKASDSRAIPPFQSLSHSNGREQAKALTLKREARERSRRGGSMNRSHSLDSERTQADRLKTRLNAPTPKQHPPQPRSRSLSAGIYAARMLILSVGIGVLVGTMLSMLDPVSRSSAGASQQATKKTDATESVKATQVTATSPGISLESASPGQLPKMGQELTSLKAALQTLALQNPQLTPGIFLFDLDTSSYVDLNGGASFAAASTIKVPILIAFFQDVDAGKIRLDEPLTIQKELVAGGSGEMQGLPIGTQFTALETVTKMITISDNTATNMVIARLGGMASLDQRFRSWGLVSTAINNLLPDLSGTNTTSPKDMALLMTRISQEELVSMRSRDRLLDIMQRTVNRSQLPQGLGKGATIAHKTGDIGGMIGDVGLIDMPNGKRYALTVLVKRSFNDDEAYDLVQKASSTVYQYLIRVPATQSDPALRPTAHTEPSLPQAGNDVPANPGSPSMPTETAINQPPLLDTATR